MSELLMTDSQTRDGTDIAGNLREIHNKIVTISKRTDRKGGEVTLIAVSKVQPVAKMEAALAAGHRVFGENRIQEAQSKWPALKALYPDVTLHLIGPLQTNKAKDAVALFDVIQTLDRPKLAEVLKREMDRQDLHRPCYIQVNTGEEPQKAGIAPADVDPFVAKCRDEIGLNIVGLMCIPPADEEAALHFALLRDIARRNGLESLSMGMSGDFEAAVELGATHVRVGAAIFGAREHG
jgi:pyridoxal phosphate enzyme (YggS family)